MVPERGREISTQLLAGSAWQEIIQAAAANQCAVLADRTVGEFARLASEVRAGVFLRAH